MASQAFPADAAGGGSYVCTDARGRRVQDRPFADCTGEQVQKNADGSTRRVVPRPLTDEERATAEQREREKAIKDNEHVIEIRNNRNLLKRYPDEAAHNRARKADLDEVRRSMQAIEKRIRDLRGERKVLADEEEFYVGKPLPAKLRGLIDANEAALQAQQELLANREAELSRIDAKFDTELVHMRELWKAASR